ncbi:hypothetical protein HMPREF3232_00878 [Fannyhessea vaginae]|nr:hypothetical protein HMPREF3232_00878 [Fannyhessea vaginae]
MNFYLFSRAHHKSCVLPSIYNKITVSNIFGRPMQKIYQANINIYRRLYSYALIC